MAVSKSQKRRRLVVGLEVKPTGKGKENKEKSSQSGAAHFVKGL